ncbi:MAG TPA: trimeric intracellular cation channel family protein [Puia sp.]|nr:trimeric intracellular cation channel family protein [Puia sp.]
MRPFAEFIDILGTFSFAVSGAFAAMEKRLDPFGVLILAFITAIGGGTVRDLLIGDTPVAWLQQPSIGWIIIAGAAGALFLGRRLKKMQFLLTSFDALGLGLFTIIGIQKGLLYHLGPGVCIALGTMTGCFGGVIRDIVLNKVPLIFQKDIYASASILGGVAYFLLINLTIPDTVAAAISIVLIFATRMLGIRYSWHLPVWYQSK